MVFCECAIGSCAQAAAQVRAVLVPIIGASTLIAVAASIQHCAAHDTIFNPEVADLCTHVRNKSCSLMRSRHRQRLARDLSVEDHEISVTKRSHDSLDQKGRITKLTGSVDLSYFIRRAKSYQGSSLQLFESSVELLWVPVTWAAFMLAAMSWDFIFYAAISSQLEMSDVVMLDSVSR